MNDDLDMRYVAVQMRLMHQVVEATIVAMVDHVEHDVILVHDDGVVTVWCSTCHIGHQAWPLKERDT